MNRAEVDALVAEMRVSATNMDSPAGMANLLRAGAAVIAELVDDEKLTVEDLFAQAAVGAILEDVYANDFGEDYSATEVADEAYTIAEAMMIRRRQ